MLLIEFDENIKQGDCNILKYRNVEDADWHYLYVDLATLKLKKPIGFSGRKIP